VGQLANAQEVFYEGLADLAAEGPDAQRVKELDINGVRVTVTDKLGIGGSGGSSGGSGGGAVAGVLEDTGIRLQFVESVELGGGQQGEAGGRADGADAAQQAVEAVAEAVEGGKEELAAEDLIAELMGGGEGGGEAGEQGEGGEGEEERV
jgi:hypothetical protein